MVTKVTYSETNQELDIPHINLHPPVSTITVAETAHIAAVFALLVSAQHAAVTLN